MGIYGNYNFGSSSYRPPAASSSNLSATNKAHEDFMLHLVTSQHYGNITQADLADHSAHHLQLVSLFKYFHSHPTDFSGLSNLQGLVKDSTDYAKDQSDMASQAAWFIKNFPNGANQAALDTKDHVTNADIQESGFTANQILGIEQGTMAASEGISTKDLIDAWTHMTADTSKNNVQLSDVAGQLQHHTEMSTILNALANDPNITDPTLKATAVKYTGKNATMANSFQWIKDHFSQIAAAGGDSNKITVNDLENFLDQNATQADGSAFNLAPAPQPPVHQPPVYHQPPSNNSYGSYLQQILQQFFGKAHR